jgi:hypothetical protein
LLSPQYADNASRDEIILYAKRLTAAAMRIPHQEFGTGMTDLHGMSTAQRLSVLRVLAHRPSPSRVKEVFGAWLKVLIAAGVLEDDVRRTQRGIQCLAADGHVCFSLGEKTIDDFLHANGIAHEKEPTYPEGSYRGDFLVGEVLIEYFGLTGDPDYDAKTREKRRICELHGVTLIALFPADLVNGAKLATKLKHLIPTGTNASVGQRPT